jgi:hypothetical protein
MGCGLDGWVLNPGRDKIFTFSTMPRPFLGLTQPPVQWVPAVIFLGIKQLGHEADHSPVFSVEVKNG